MKCNLKKTVVYPCSMKVVSVIWVFHITLFQMTGSTGREAVRTPGFASYLSHWFTPWPCTSPWALSVASDILHSQNVNYFGTSSLWETRDAICFIMFSCQYCHLHFVLLYLSHVLKKHLSQVQFVKTQKTKRYVKKMLLKPSHLEGKSTSEVC